MSLKSMGLAPDLLEYQRSNSVREAPILRQLREETARLAQANMQIAQEQGQFMGLLVRLIGARRCLEVGVFTGYSTLVTALALPDDGRIVACDVSEEWTAIGRRFWEEGGVGGKIDLRLAPAVETLDALIAAGEQGRYDFAFIDADKTNYVNYYERCLALLRTGGLIAIDNVLWSGDVIDPSKQDPDTVAIRALNEHVRDDERVDISLVPIADGLTLLRKR